MRKEKSFLELLHARRKNLDIEQSWGLQDATLLSYEMSFQALLRSGDLNKILREIKFSGNGNKTYTLDLMGSGSAIEEIENADYILGVELTNRNYLSSKRRSIITGDIISKTTWKIIREWIDKESHGNRTTFDLITCRPEGGIHTLPDNYSLFQFFFEQSLKLLGDHGVLITQLPGSLSGSDGQITISSWIKRMEKDQKISIRYQSSASTGSTNTISAILVQKDAPYT
ncbi:MAG: hypothetical protein Q8P26_00795 [Candidatus Levybacteria bacterium]|nr:hypothetical protein [Candidatus Levybacteria bacterium]